MIRRLAMIGAVWCAAAAQAQAAEPFQGFNLGGKAINPVCLQKMAPWASDNGIIVRSIVLETCQDSNWAFNDQPVQVAGDTVSTVIEDEPFSYQVLGKTTSGVFVLKQTGNEIYAYRIDVVATKPDLLAPATRPVHVLTVLGESFVPCLQSAVVQGDKLVVKKQVSDMNASRAEQCKTKVQTVQYPIAP
ncbi:MAG TPA: hypothetical protein PLV04_13215 [Phenylobacterium sp.]|nr:hypothetical protein [Phenylobacterium sp.]HQP20629.1 hypothetical protein [Phenylobacterium sp.]